MDLIKLSGDLSEMEEYQPLPAGPYRAEIREVEIKHSEKVPTGYIYMKLLVHPDDFPADYDRENAPEGVSVTYANVKVPDASNRRTIGPFKKLLKAVGMEAQGSEFDPSAWIGQECQVFLTVNEYQGAFTNNVDSVKELPSV